MAGLVPAIHVVTRPNTSRWPGRPRRARRASGKYFAVQALDHVDDRDQPVHDGRSGLNCFAAAPHRQNCSDARSTDLAAELVLDMDADDLVERRLGFEAQLDAAPGVEVA